jgi:glycosyltransferase involved in cell wall biosynthesis
MSLLENRIVGGMRILVIGHAYIARDNRIKWETLAETREVEIELHLPHRWPSWEEDYRAKDEDRPNLRVRGFKACRAGREDQYFFAPDLFRGMSASSFDILHVEQGAAAFVYSQALFERQWRSPKTRTCFFTWINWEPRMRWPWRMAERYNLRRTDGAICGNSGAVDVLRRHGFQGKVEVIPQLGVNADFYSPAPQPELAARLGLKGVVIGFVGRLVPEKGAHLLLDAVRGLKDSATLLLIGDGPLTGEIHARADREGIQLVHVPAVEHDRVRDYLRVMDMLVLPSYDTPFWKEQFGHVLIEAMGCQVPVVGSDAGAIPEVIGEAGLIFPSKSVEALRESLRALAQSPGERRRLGEAGRARVLERFTHRMIAQQTLEFWKTLL